MDAGNHIPKSLNLKHTIEDYLNDFSVGTKPSTIHHPYKTSLPIVMNQACYLFYRKNSEWTRPHKHKAPLQMKRKFGSKDNTIGGGLTPIGNRFSGLRSSRLSQQQPAVLFIRGALEQGSRIHDNITKKRPAPPPPPSHQVLSATWSPGSTCATPVE